MLIFSALSLYIKLFSVYNFNSYAITKAIKKKFIKSVTNKLLSYLYTKHLFLSLTNHHIESLLELCKTGNQKAQIEVYNRYYKAMYNTSLRIVKDPYEAEDIMQDSMLTAFSKLKSLKNLATFGAWLKRIVVNNSIYHYNKINKHDEVPLDSVIYKVEAPLNLKEDETFTSIKAAEILDTLKQLKENYQLCLTLHLIEGYDYEEITEIMNISEANCRTLISRAKASLRQKLKLLAER